MHNWSEIDIITFIELFSLNRNDYQNEDEYNVHLLSIISDISLEDIENMDYNEFNKLLEDYTFIKQLPNKQPKLIIDTPAGTLYLIQDLKQISIGEFIDLENLFIDGYIKNLTTILSILYRQKDVKQSLLYLDKFEPYGDWIFHRSSLFNNITISDVYGIIPKYLKFRAEFFETYQGLFDDSGNDNDEDYVPDKDESIISKSERKKEQLRNESLKKWNWDIYLYKLAKNDPIKLDEATRMPLLQAFNILSMCRELGITD